MRPRASSHGRRPVNYEDGPKDWMMFLPSLFKRKHGGTTRWTSLSNFSKSAAFATRGYKSSAGCYTRLSFAGSEEITLHTSEVSRKSWRNMGSLVRRTVATTLGSN